MSLVKSRNGKSDDRFVLPGCSDPINFISKTVSLAGDSRIQMKHGTTTLAFKFSGGIVLAVDSRGTSGSYIVSSTVEKVIAINGFMVGTMAGGAADCDFWERLLKTHCRRYELENKERITVAAASKLLCRMIMRYKGMGLSMGTMIAGWDRKGPGIYYVDSDGTRISGDLFSVGSGSTFAYGILDAEYKYEMDVEEALELGEKAIYHAAHRDAGSGGFINLHWIDSTGWKFVRSKDFMDAHTKYGSQNKH